MTHQPAYSVSAVSFRIIEGQSSSLSFMRSVFVSIFHQFLNAREASGKFARPKQLSAISTVSARSELTQCQK
jgi:hypothetical protein